MSDGEVIENENEIENETENEIENELISDINAIISRLENLTIKQESSIKLIYIVSGLNIFFLTLIIRKLL